MAVMKNCTQYCGVSVLSNGDGVDEPRRSDIVVVAVLVVRVLEYVDVWLGW